MPLNTMSVRSLWPGRTDDDRVIGKSASAEKHDGVIGAICQCMGEVGFEAYKRLGHDQVPLVIDKDEQFDGSRDNDQRRVWPEAALAR